MTDQILTQLQDDTKAAMKAGEKSKVAALRLLTSAVQSAIKDGDGDLVAVLGRERKKRLEAAEAYGKAERPEQAEAERLEAELIAAYLPEQVSDEELTAIVADAIEQSGASSIKDMGQVMGIVMPKVKGRADGNRVSAAAREKLGS
jgi:uncharacterized protein YqeY